MKNSNHKILEYCKVPVTNVTMSIVEGLNKIRLSELDEYSYELNQNVKDGSVTLEQFNNLSLPQLKKSTSISQIQLFMFLLSVWADNDGCNTILIDRRMYFKKYKMVTPHHKNNKQFECDLEVLSNLNFQLDNKFKNRIETIYGPLLQFSKQNQSVYEIEFSDWINSLKPHYYTMLHKNFFKYHGRTDWFTSLMNLKLSQKAKMDLTQRAQGKISVKSVFDFTGVTNQLMIKNGLTRYKKLLSSAIKSLEEEGYTFTFDDGNLSLINLRKSMIVFKNKELHSHYGTPKSA